MTQEKDPIVIKKYANRRLYNTGSSTYVTLEDLAAMVKSGDDFVVQEAKTGEDITRAVLGQIIFEQEGKDGQNLLPTNFLRQLISFYGDSMQNVVPSYLEVSMKSLAAEQEKFREQMASAMKASTGLGDAAMQNPFANAIPGAAIPQGMQEQIENNMEIFQKTMAMFTPFGAPAGSSAQPETAAEPAAPAQSSADDADSDDLETLQEELAAMQAKLAKLATKK